MPDTSTCTTVPPDAEGFVPNGYVEEYPHADFDGPCVGQCCIPEAYPKPLVWTCQNQGCYARLRQPGECINCYPPTTPIEP